AQTGARKDIATTATRSTRTPAAFAKNEISNGCGMHPRGTTQSGHELAIGIDDLHHPRKGLDNNPDDHGGLCLLCDTCVDPESKDDLPNERGHRVCP
ncbi:MAG: hypothetical protein ACKPKO_34580, partial [Candidatus Fonsibacter sp.]